jgi:polysaccharide biosynthesis protein PslG
VTAGLVNEARAQNLHYGMNTRVLTAQMADKMVELGADIVRLPYGWDLIEPACKGCFDWSVTDAWRDEARRTHRVIFGSLAYAPRWANGGHTYNYPPLVYQDYYDFVYAVVSRYKDDVYLWGIWNEPNLDLYLSRGDVEVYEALAIVGRSAIRAANPKALVLGPEISYHAALDGFFQRVMRSAGALFDIVTVHWYGDGPKLDAMMDQLVRPFSYGKDVWLTETGWHPCQSFFGEIDQALFYRQVLEAFWQRRSWWTSVMFYDLHDPPDAGGCGSGITRPDWSKRPAFNLFQAFMKLHP